MSNFLKCHYEYDDTDSIKQYFNNDNALTKQALNSIYGKEVGMKDYIVVHQDNKTGIIFKKDIGAVLETAGGTQLYVNGYSIYCDDKYKEIVARVLK